MAEPAAAIVARNGGAELAEAVLDLVRIVGEKNVLVVDNASTDGSTDGLAVEVQKQPANLGYAAGANVALAWAAARGAAELLLLNQDARIEPTDAGRMFDLIKSDANAGAVFALVVQRGRPYLLDGAFGRRNLRHKLTTGLGAGAVRRDVWSKPLAVHHGHGAALLLRVRAAQQVGGFDESLFAYHDEVDLCWRLNRAHWAVLFEPRAVVRHDGPDADPARRRMKAYLIARNSLRVARKNAGAWGWLRVAAWALAATLVYYGPLAIGGDAEARAYLAGWRDGALGRVKALKDLI